MTLNQLLPRTITSIPCWLLLMLAACSNTPRNIPHKEYLLELSGNPGTQCEITNDQEIIGTFTIPTTVSLGSNVGTIEANCTIDNKTVVATAQAADAQCHDKLVVKGPCPKSISTVESVEIVIRQSK